MKINGGMGYQGAEKGRGMFLFASGTFHAVLKHQPGTNTNLSGVTVGETDLDITFTINVQ